MKEENNFWCSFIKGFLGSEELNVNTKEMSPNYLNSAYKYFKNTYKKMSENNDAKEKLLYKEQ